MEKLTDEELALLESTGLGHRAVVELRALRQAGAWAMSEHKPTLITACIDRQFECSCGFRTRVADSLNVSIFDIEEEFRRHAAEQERGR